MHTKQPIERAADSVVGWNNRRILRAEVGRDPMRSVERLRWHLQLVDAWPEIRAEWDAFVDASQRLPLLRDVVGQDLGNTGEWFAGVFLSGGVPVPTMARWFPRTLAAVSAVPGLRYAMWSVLGPGTELAVHTGLNAGVLRYHLGIDCGHDAALRIGEHEYPYLDGEGILFDDMAEHTAWNRGPTPRVTLFLELDRGLPRVASWRNRVVQRVIATTPGYRHVPDRAEKWHSLLNHES